MNIMTIAHSSELNNFSIAIASKREHILKIPMLTIWIFRLRCVVPPTNCSWVRKVQQWPTSHTPKSKHVSGMLISIHSTSSSFMKVDNIAPQIH